MPALNNSFKKDPEPGKPEKSPEEKGPVRKPSGRILRPAFLSDERTPKIMGAMLMLCGLYLFVAFTSFIFTWQDDYSEVTGPWMDFIRSDAEAGNWLGKLGAIVSHTFIHKWFGVSSFIIAYLSFVSGFKLLFEYSLVPMRKSYSYGIFALIYLSVALGYLLKIRFLGGAFGYYSSRWLNGLLGMAGTGLLLFFVLVGFLIIAFNFSFKDRLQQLTVSKEKEGTDAIEASVESEVKPADVTNKVVTPIAAATVVANAENSPKIKNAFIPKTQPSFEIENDFEEEAQAGLPGSIDQTGVPIVTVNESIYEVELKEEEEIEDLTEEELDELQEELEEEEETDFTAEELEEAVDKMSVITMDDIDIHVTEVSAESQPAEEISQTVEALGPYDPTLDLGRYQLPPLDLLENYGTNKIQVDREELEENKNRIVETLGHYSIEIEKIKATIGPTVTLYEIVPKAGVRISKIKNLEDDIALSLSALGIRIIAPIPGKGTIGIEVPNQKPDVVGMKSVLASEKFQNSDMDLPVALGKTIQNEVFVTDLAKMPHLLMAGATGQGKSVGLNAILVSLLYKKHPSQVKLVLVDPKKVELTLFKRIERHFLAKLPGEEEAIITDTKKVINTLNSLCIEMDQRYDLLKEAQVRNIKEYNAKFVQRRLNPEKGHRYLPYIVLVVDEFADLIMTAGKEVELPIARLAQLARAIGIHLIIATQRPSVNIITGTIKANFPSRIAFRVTSKIDSRTILDAGGADQLIGRGDMLYSTGADLIRLQCAFVDTPEVEKITDYIGAQQGYASAFLLPEYIDEKSEGNSGLEQGDLDVMFEEAARIVVQSQQGSASLLQRKLKLGYNRAGRLIDQLEQAGIIGPFEGSKAREVRIMDEMSLREIISKLKQ